MPSVIMAESAKTMETKQIFVVCIRIGAGENFSLLLCFPMRQN